VAKKLPTMQTVRKTIYFLLLGATLSSCNSALQTFKKGQKKFENGEYELAIKDFQSSLAANYSPANNNYLIAESYRLSNRPLQAADYYEKALTAGSKENDLRFHYAFAQKAQGKYQEAAQNLEKYLSGVPSKEYKNKAQTELDLLPEIEALTKRKTYIEVKPVGVNTSGTEFAPIIRDNSLIFTASRKEITYKNNGLPYLGLYRAALNSPTETGNAELFSPAIFKDNANEGTPAFSKDGKLMVFARGNTGKRSDASPDVDLYISRNTEGVWSEPELIEALSDSLSWDGCPTFSADARTLYFGSNRKGGRGGIDLYRATLDNSQRFGKPINLGGEINTAGDEMFPTVTPEGKLHFSSDGHAGLGGLDLYSASRKDGNIVVEHLGLPINSRFDDFGLVAIDSTKGYFASNREGGRGDDDIYFYENTQPGKKFTEIPPVVTKKDDGKKIIRYFLAGIVADAGNAPLDSVRVTILNNEGGVAIDEIYSNAGGNFGKTKLEEGKSYSILLEKKGYLAKRENFTMIGKAIPLEKLTKAESDTTFYINAILDKPTTGIEISKQFNIAPIYYDLNQSFIRIDASVELDKIVQVLFDNPTIKLELGSHTDSRGTIESNNSLSQRRADAAVKYIISKGIAPDRIVARGYGESQLINTCADNVPCSEEEHQMNRRTEFKVIGVK
jgi:peptidoglycan-associated lipoprotein